MRPVRNSTDYIVWHCSASAYGVDVRARDIDAMHRQRGWQGIGYHLVICRDGTIETGEELHRMGAHTKGFNAVSVGICMIGGVNKDGDPSCNFTKAQWATAFNLSTVLSSIYPNAITKGHRDFSPDANDDGEISEWEFMKRCPTFDAGRTFKQRKIVTLKSDKRVA